MNLFDKLEKRDSKLKVWSLLNELKEEFEKQSKLLSMYREHYSLIDVYHSKDEERVDYLEQQIKELLNELFSNR